VYSATISSTDSCFQAALDVARLWIRRRVCSSSASVGSSATRLLAWKQPSCAHSFSVCSDPRLRLFMLDGADKAALGTREDSLARRRHALRPDFVQVIQLRVLHHRHAQCDPKANARSDFRATANATPLPNQRGGGRSRGGRGSRRHRRPRRRKTQHRCGEDRGR